MSHIGQIDITAINRFFILQLSLILKGVQKLHLNTETPRNNDGMENASTLMMQLCGRQVMIDGADRGGGDPRHSGRFPDGAPVVSRYPMHVQNYEGRRTRTVSGRDTRLAVHVAVWERWFYWQRRGVVLLLDTKTGWMVHVNYKSGMNHLVFS